jgi:hypothetical protein
VFVVVVIAATASADKCADSTINSVDRNIESHLIYLSSAVDRPLEARSPAKERSQQTQHSQMYRSQFKRFTYANDRATSFIERFTVNVY